MSKAQGLHRYLRTISRKLVCYKDTKQTLLEGLEQELSVYSSLSYDELCQEIGNPTQVSAQLMENISEQEIAYMKRRRKMILCTVSICFVIAFALAVFYFVHAQSVMRGDFYVQEHNSTFTVREKTITRQADAYHGSTYIGTFYLTGTFQYDARKAVATSDSWRASSPSYSYSGKSSHSGASVSGSCTFNYLGGKTYKLTMTCDKNGNMSYTQ